MSIFEAVKKSAEWIVKKFYERDTNATLSRSKNSQAPARNNASADSGEVQGEMQSQEQVASCGGPEPPDPDDDEESNGVDRVVNSINNDREMHILQDHHQWRRLFKDPFASWNEIKKIMCDVIKTGEVRQHGGNIRNLIFSKKINNEIIEVIVRMEGSRFSSIVNAWIKNI